MTQLPIVQAPADVLNQVAKPVTFKEPQLCQLILDMVETLEKHDDPPGVGLAAPQIGVSLRIFLALLGTTGEEKDLKNGYIEVFINPEIINSTSTDKSLEDDKTAEGCLSLNKYYGQVRRSPQVDIKYQTVDTNQLKKTKDIKPIAKTVTYKDFEARIMQHEVDHLNGRLFTTRVVEQSGKLFRVEEENGHPVWEEVELI